MSGPGVAPAAKAMIELLTDVAAALHRDARRRLSGPAEAQPRSATARASSSARRPTTIGRSARSSGRASIPTGPGSTASE